MANAQKTYQINIELDQARQDLADAGKLLDSLKTKTKAANEEVKETKEVYKQNADALKELVQEQKQLEAAKKSAAAGAGALTAQADLDKNLAAQKKLNAIVQESRIDFEAAKEAASAAGKAVAAQADVTKGLAGSVKDYGAAAKAAQAEFAPGTVGALRQEVEQLKADLDNLVPGSAAAAEAIQALGAKQSALRELALATNAANPRAQARAFTVLAGALTGVVGIATTAAQVFGLSDETAQKYAQRMQALVGVLYSVEQVNKALNAENVSLFRSIVASGKAWLGFGESAATAGKATRAALITSGIGIILVAVSVVLGLVVANWDKLTSSVKGSIAFIDKFKAVFAGLFDGAIAGLKNFFSVLGDLVTLDFSGAIKKAGQAGKEVAGAYRTGYAESIRDSQREAIELQIQAYARQIDLAKAQGKETLQLEIENARRLVNNLKDSTKDQKKIKLDAQNELNKLLQEQIKKGFDDSDAITLQRLNQQAQMEAAKGREVFAKQLAVKKQELSDLKTAKDQGLTQSATAIQSKQDEIDAFQAAHAKELDDKARAALLARLDARIALTQAKGRESYAQEVARDQQQLAFLKTAGIRNEAEITAQLGKIAALKATHQREQVEKARAAELATLDASISLQQTKGADAFADQVKREERQLQFLNQAGIKNQAAIIAQQSKIDNLKAAHAKKQEADLRAASIARTQVELAVAQAEGKDVSELEIRIKEKELAGLLAAADRNEAAIIAKDGEIAAARITQMQKEFEKRRTLLQEEQDYELAMAEKKGKDTLGLQIRQAQQLVDQDTDTSERGLKQKKQDIEKLNLLLEEKRQRAPDLGGAILTKAFGVSEEDLPRVKAAISAAYEQIANAASLIYQNAMAGVEQEIQDATDQVDKLGKQLSDVQSQLSSNISALDGAKGAKRNYLLQQINNERAAEERLAAAKAKAAADEQRAMLKKQALEKESQQITAATTAITTAATAAEAIYAAVKAISGANDLPFPASIIAVVTALAATAGAIGAARNLGKTFADGTGALGEDGVLQGPSHAQGGIQIFGKDGKHYGEAEGGEAITPVDASKNNAAALQLIRTAGRTRVLTPADFAKIADVRVLPPPAGHFAAGGVLGTGCDVAPGTVNVSSADLSTLIGLTQQVVAHVQATAANTQAVASFGPPILAFGQEEEQKRQEMAQGMSDTKAAASL